MGWINPSYVWKPAWEWVCGGRWGVKCATFSAANHLQHQNKDSHKPQKAIKFGFNSLNQRPNHSPLPRQLQAGDQEQLFVGLDVTPGMDQATKSQTQGLVVMIMIWTWPPRVEHRTWWWWWWWWYGTDHQDQESNTGPSDDDDDMEPATKSQRQGLCGVWPDARLDKGW